MSNMSYCRFTNTRGDLEDCLNAIEMEDKLSDFEAQAGKRLFKAFLTFCRDRDIIDSYDGDAIDDMFQSLMEHEDAE